MKISASLLSARDNLETITKELNNLDIDYIHLDIMDGLFVPNTSYTDEEINLIMNITNKKLDVHLMVNDIDKYVNYYLKDNVESITFHYEAMNDINIINKIKNNGIKCGISIKPNTNVEKIYHLLPLIDKVLVMSVEPGKGGQKFIPESEDKINELYTIREKYGYHYLIEVDGGINIESKDNCKNADILVVGSYITMSDNPNEKYISIINEK